MASRFSNAIARLSMSRLACSPPALLPNASMKIFSQGIPPARSRFHHLSQPSSKVLQALKGTTPRRAFPSFAFKAAGLATIGLALGSLNSPTIRCDAVSPAPPQNTPPPPPRSSINVYELSFGTVCGICTGVFVKKGAKALAFILGGIFVLLQYLGSMSIVRIDWARVGTRFQNAFYTTDVATGARTPPTVSSVWTWLVDFLTADFQPRATFIAGLMLGLRIG